MDSQNSVVFSIKEYSFATGEESCKFMLYITRDNGNENSNTPTWPTTQASHISPLGSTLQS